jgi:hypothetical protein
MGHRRNKYLIIVTLQKHAIPPWVNITSIPAAKAAVLQDDGTERDRISNGKISKTKIPRYHFLSRMSSWN